MLRTSMKEKDQEIRAANHRAAESQSDNQQLAKRINDLQNELQDLESAKVDEGRQRQMI
jgi:septal ring factor EnvC (AmiA/AmiB activator)